jgi:hypothetical protein
MHYGGNRIDSRDFQLRANIGFLNALISGQVTKTIQSKWVVVAMVPPRLLAVRAFRARRFRR